MYHKPAVLHGHGSHEYEINKLSQDSVGVVGACLRVLNLLHDFRLHR